MKRLTLSTLILVFALFFVACNKDQVAPEEQNVNTSETVKKGISSPIITYDFNDVPDEVVKKAQEAYGSQLLPAVVVAFTYTRGDSNISLEDNWNFGREATVFSLTGERPWQGWDVEFYSVGAFHFIEEDQLLGGGFYSMDNFQGGWFDHVCGPGSVNFKYEEGKTTFKLVRLWCE